MSFLFSRLGGSGPVIWSYFAEFQPKAKRGSMLSFMAAFWTLGNLFVACESQDIEEFLQVHSISRIFVKNTT
jgi:MFS family permease